MKKCLSTLICMFFLMGCIHMTALAIQEDFDISSGHSGFNGYKWCTHLSECKSFVLVKKLPKIRHGGQYYDPDNVFANYLGYKVKILYNFTNNKLFCVVMIFPIGYKVSKVASLINSRYGTPTYGDMQMYTWKFGTSEMYWYFMTNHQDRVPAQVVILDSIQMKEAYIDGSTNVRI